jgi:deoxyribonuclease V
MGGELRILNTEKMIEIQKSLVKEIKLDPMVHVPEKIAGFDLSYPSKNTAIAVCVVMTYPNLELCEMKWTEAEIDTPYIPTFLAFREGPAIEKVYSMIDEVPDLLFFDGQGIAHPRGLGIAAYMSLKFQKPSIGVAKSHLFGQYKMPSSNKGAFEYIYDHADIIGAVLRTKSNVKPLFVSPGSFLSVQDSIDYTLKTCKGYRLPEPTRLADMYSKRLRKEVNT